MLQRAHVCRCLAAARLTPRRRAEGMDWYAWLCRAGLHPDVALEYALLFARNELGAGDVRHLDHEVLASMGVAVAKHRIEILKLAGAAVAALRGAPPGCSPRPRAAPAETAESARQGAGGSAGGGGGHFGAGRRGGGRVVVGPTREKVWAPHEKW